MFLRFLDKIERRERIGNAITLRKEKDTWLWLYRLKATGSLSKAVLKNDPLWWNGISRVSRCYLSLPTQYQFVIPQTGGDIKAELRPSFGRDFHINIEQNINSNMIWLTWKIGKMIRDRKWKIAAPPHVILHSFSAIGVNTSFEMSLTQLEMKPMPRLTGAQDILSFTCAFTQVPFCPTFI